MPTTRGRRRQGFAPRFLYATTLVLSSVASREASAQLADDSDALPGFGGVAVPTLELAPRGAVVASGGYAMHPDALGAGSFHHRARGALAGSVHVLPWLAFAARVDGRYDAVSTPSGSDDGLVGLASLAARASAEPTRGLTLGLDLQVRFPGGDAPSFDPDATSLLVRAMVADRLELGSGSALVLVLDAGYDLDNSRAAAPRSFTDNLTSADRLALGVTDFGSVVVDVGALVALDSFEGYGTVTSRLFVDGSAPTVSNWLALTLGGRAWLADRALFLGGEVSANFLADHPTLANPGIATVSIEPLLTATLVAGARFGERATGASSGESSGGDDPQSTAAAAPTSATLRGDVLDDQGAPVAGAVVELVGPTGATATTQSGTDGHWELASLPLGPARLRITPPGGEAQELDVDVQAEAAPVRTTYQRPAALPRGEIRGVVQGANGGVLSARITIHPTEQELTTDAEGSFALEVPPGEYDVEIEASGHRAQTRHVTVDERGVVVLNIQLRRAH